MNFNNYSIEEIRFLPMSKKIFSTKTDVIRFLETGLHEQNGYFYHIRRTIKYRGNTLVLFQYRGELIASAIMVGQDDVTKLEDDIKYNGRYKFDLSTLVIFHYPITKAEYGDIDSKFTKFGQSARQTNICYLNQVIKLIEEKSCEGSHEELIQEYHDYEKLNAPRIDSVDKWVKILTEELTNNNGFDFVGNVLVEMYKKDDCTIFCKDFEEEIGYKGLNLRVGEFRNRIKRIKGINIEEQLRNDTNRDRAWNIPFKTNRKLNESSENKGRFSWVLRDEVIQALEIIIPEIKAFRNDSGLLAYGINKSNIAMIKDVEYVKAEVYLNDYPDIEKRKCKKGKAHRKKIDYLRKLAHDKALGDTGEAIVVQQEKKRLIDQGLEELADKVHIVDSDDYGYDVISYYENGNEKHIEVKTSVGLSGEIGFYISDNEVQTMLEDSAFELHYVQGLKDESLKIVVFTQWDLKQYVMDKFMKPVKYEVRIPINIAP